MQAYCFKCRTKREMDDPTPVFMSNGRPATRGQCPECGTGLFKIGHTPAHDGLEVEGNIYGLSGRLVIVESPTKARTVGRILGEGYEVRASVGHVRDLPANRLGVDVENGFEPRYVVPSKKKAVVRDLRQVAKKAAEIYLQEKSYRKAGELFYRAGERLRAAQVLEEALKQQASRMPEEMSPSDCRMLSNLGFMIGGFYQQEGQMDQAAAAYESGGHLAEAAGIQEQMGRYSLASKLYSKAGEPFKAAICMDKLDQKFFCV